MGRHGDGQDSDPVLADFHFTPGVRSPARRSFRMEFDLPIATASFCASSCCCVRPTVAFTSSLPTNVLSFF